MSDQNDWRLLNQEKYLKGVTVVLRRYRRYPKNINWDHDHCAFCWVEFNTEDFPDVLHKGYCTLDEYYWICETCFNDFKDLFEWVVIKEIE
jgi:hypothetical protein